MEPVCDLQGIRGAVRGAFGVDAGPVPADHLHPGVSRQPCGQRCRLATRQHVDGPVPFTIRDHSGVRVAAPGGEIVDTEDLRGAVERVRHGPNPVQQPHPTCCQTQSVGHARSGTAGQRERDPVQQRAEPIRDTGVRAGQPWYLLGERALRTSAVNAYEAPHQEQDPYRVPGQRKILQATPVAVMHTCRRPAASRTRARVTADTEPHHHPARTVHRRGDQHLEFLEQHVLPGEFVVAHALDVDPEGTVQPAPPEPDGASRPAYHGGAYPGSRTGFERPLHGP